ncbi:MAG: hypothetical protein Q8P41_31645 [Pseudomonadota bacterium]|nr:hypothetical protein [Pseudomonadota bacterium]
MSFETFPYVAPADAPRVGAKTGIAFLTEVTTARSGMELARIVRSTGRGTLEMDWSRKENAFTIASAIFNFFCARKGRAGWFGVFDFETLRVYTDVRVTVATAGQTVLNLPSRNATSVTVKLNGVTKTGTFAALAGLNGRDRFTLTVGATGGEIVTVSFTGQRFYVVRFTSDEMTVEYLTNRLTGGLGIQLIEKVGAEP